MSTISATLALTNSVVSNNLAGGYGGGLYIASGKATLTNSTFSNNTAGPSYYGGGIYNNATAIVTSCTLNNNAAGRYGGGMYNNATATLTNSTFSGNLADTGWYGGALYNDGTVALVSCTLSNNTATIGGGFYNNRGLSLFNTIVAGNTAANGSPDVFGTVGTLGNNLIGNTQGTIGWRSSDLTNIDAKLAPLGFYGGPTQTMAMSPSSPAIHKGVAAGTTSDQRGFPLDSPSDIGAFQLQPNTGSLQVNTTADGSGVASGKLDLRGATNLANVLSGPHIISFDPTVFATAQTITLTAGQLELSNVTLTGAETIIGPAAGLTINAGGLNRVFQIDVAVEASLSGLTITGGGGTADRGGGILNLATANLTMTNCTITGNSGSTNGGGIANYGVVILNNCTISGNTAGQNGGGFFTVGSDSSSRATLTNCTISGNASRGAQGGGGVYLRGLSLNVTGSTISNNTATQSGGGVWMHGTSYSVISLSDCTVSGNSAGGAGGGVENDMGLASLTNCTLAANNAGGGGGGVMNNNSQSTANLTNCTLTGNTGNGGGGLYNRGTLTMTSCTVTANSGGNKGGGGMFNLTSPATLNNTIVALNTNGSTPGAPNDIGGGISVSGTFNLIGIGGSGGLTNGVSGNLVGVADPGLAKLDFYGGPTQTMALLPGSTAIGKGTKVGGITTDQRGLPLDSPPDIGAFQVQSGPLAWQVNTSIDGTSSKLDLRGAINLANILSGAHTITFSPTVFASPQTIKLKPGQLELSNTSVRRQSRARRPE